jgi:Ca-activated chloride channel family protein
VVAQNVEIDFQPAPTVQLVQTFGYQAQQTGNQITVKLNDIFSEEEKTVLFKLKVPGETAADFRIGSLKVVYDDVILKNERIEKSFSPVLTFTTDKSLFATGSNQLVKENIALFESALMLDEAITNVDQRKFDKAKSINSLNLSFLQQQLAHNSSKRLKQQVLDVMKYESETKKAEKYDVQEMNEFQKDAKFQNYLQRKKR